MITYNFATILNRTLFLSKINAIYKEYNKNPLINVNGKNIEINYENDTELMYIINSEFLKQYPNEYIS